MREISNKTLAILLIATIAVSLGGTLLSLGKLQKIQLATITGYDTLTQEGSVEATVTSNTAINFTTNTVSFGTGTVTSGCNNCTMHTPSVTDSTCCSGFTAPASGLVLENVGNRNASINLNFSQDAASFIGGSSPLLQMNLTEGEAGSCINASGTETSGINVTWNHTFADVKTDDPQICEIFRPGLANDELSIDIKVKIPDNSETGLRNATVTATASTV